MTFPCRERHNRLRAMTANEDSNSYMKTRLFDDKPRDYTERSPRAESSYSFLDRSSLPEYERIRNMLELWISLLPKEQRKRAVANMRHKGRGSRDKENQFNAAFFELFMHEFLVGTGGNVEVEPSINGRTPDFRVNERVEDGSEIKYVVEATDLDLERGTELESGWNELSAIDALNEIECDDFLLFVRTKGNLNSQPRKRDLKRPFEELVEHVKYDELLRISARPGFRFDDFPTRVFTHGNWSITGQLCPVSSETRKTGRYFVGGWSKGVDHIDDIGRTRDRLYDKSKRYKGVDNLVIALRCDNSNTRLREVLFGSQVMHVYFHKDPTNVGPLPEPRYSQRRDGFWFNSSGPQNLHVIGVATFFGVYPWSLDKATAIFYANPYLNRPMPRWANLVTHAEFSDNKINIVEGVSLTTFLRNYEINEAPYG